MRVRVGTSHNADVAMLAAVAKIAGQRLGDDGECQSGGQDWTEINEATHGQSIPAAQRS